jgi:hypothetical protein
MLRYDRDFASDADHRCFSFLTRALNPLERDVRAISALRDEIGRVAWEGVVELASQHLVTPTLHRGLADKGLLADLPAELRDYLEAIYALNGERNRQIVAQTVEIAAALNAIGIEPVVLKGVADLCAGLYRDPGARVIGDVDLLVAGDQLAAAGAALAAIGYRGTGPADFAYGAHHHDRPLARPDDAAWIELHTEPVAPAFASLLSAKRVLRDARRVVSAARRYGCPRCATRWSTTSSTPSWPTGTIGSPGCRCGRSRIWSGCACRATIGSTGARSWRPATAPATAAPAGPG